MGYVTFSLACYMVCCSIASLSVGYIYLSCFHLHSFASYDRPHVLKIKYPVTRGCQFLLDVVFCILLYERFRTCVCLLNHCYTSIAQSLYGVFPVPLGQFVSVTYPRRTGGEHFRTDHVTRNALAARKNDAQGLGKYEHSLDHFVRLFFLL